MRARRLRAALVVAGLLLVALPSGAAPVRVRFPEATARGFLAIRAPDGRRIGHGELTQKAKGEEVQSRLELRFDDGSVHDETTTFSQRGVFRLEAYRVVQRGPSFPGSEASFDRKTGRYQATAHEKPGGPAETANGEMDVPADVYNGMALLLAKNLRAGETASVQLAAFLPKPRLLRMEVRPEGEDRVVFGGAPKQATRFLVNLDIGGLTGVMASLLGKNPPDLRYWLVLGDVPAFVRFEGGMFLNGPVWRVEMAGLE